MNAEKANTLIGSCATVLTRHLMERFSLPMDEAFAKLYGSETYRVLADPESRLFLEDDDYLKTCVDKEFSEGQDSFYRFIQQ